MLTYDGSRARRRSYWRLGRTPSETLAPGDLRDLLREAVRARLMSDVPIGILLSGGIDSTAVLGLAREAGGPGIDTFTIGFADALYDERELARLAAERHGARHHEVVVDSASLPRGAAEARVVPGRADRRAVGDSVAAARRVRGASCEGGARRDGGDEVFGGYPKYRAERLLRLGRTVPSTCSGALGELGNRKPTHRRLGRAAETLSIRDEQLRWASWFRRSHRTRWRLLVGPIWPGPRRRTSCSGRSHASSRRTRASTPAAGC